MSNLVIPFKPRADLDAERCVQDFVAHCRDVVTVFGADLPFDEYEWDITEFLQLKAKRGRTRAVFSSWDTVKDAKPSPMSEPFMSFAKAYFRYQHGMRPTKSIGSRLAALRAMGAALKERGPEAGASSIDAGLLHRAAQLIKAGFEATSAYRVGGQLEMIAAFMDECRLSALPLQWRNPLRRPEDSTRVGEEFEKKRNAKLPSPYALDTLGRAFFAATETPDVLVTSMAAILCSAPDRINEVLRLRTNCEVDDKRPDGQAAYGLRFWPSKGADPMVKWIVPTMVSVVKEAIARLVLHTAPARKIAIWYEENPGCLFLPPHLEHLRKEPLVLLNEVGQILFEDKVVLSVVRTWCNSNEVPIEKHGKSSYVRFLDVEQAVIRLLPRGFPILDEETGLRYSEALCIVRRNEMHETRGTYRCAIDFLDHGSIHTGLGGRSEHGFRSVFDRLGFFEPDGSPVCIRTHQFRHYLNTLAQTGGMSELDIAMWSGRRDVRQNQDYDHVSDRDKQALIHEITEKSGQKSVALKTWAKVNIIPRAKFAELKIGSAHTTEFGYCVHDYAMSPCQLHLDCLNCNELACIKGDELRTANLRLQQSETRILLHEAKVALSEEEYGANTWVAHQTKTLERIDALLGTLENPAIPDGAVLRLNHIQPASRLQQAAVAREALSLDGPQHLPLLKLKKLG